MAWRVELDERAIKDLRRLDRPVAQLILRYLHERVAAAEDPRQFGKALTGNMRGLWRYRVGDYRLVCRLEEDRLLVLVVAVGHRSQIYR
ncbi:MAG TPA: type II toxin-antitoxin system RelE/ParE family toxin [Thermoanaerobaculia bacterium]|nr:type II toxin-antitoxin system RelE/ParE family toxin [Thermoanaerobaculia bacterium]